MRQLIEQPLYHDELEYLERALLICKEPGLKQILTTAKVLMGEAPYDWALENTNDLTQFLAHPTQDRFEILLKLLVIARLPKLKIKICDLDSLGHKNEKRWRFLRDFQTSLRTEEHKISNLSSLAIMSEVSVEAGFDIAEDNFLTDFEVDRICTRVALDLWAKTVLKKGIEDLTQTSIHMETQKRTKLIEGILFDLCIWNLVSQLSGDTVWDEFKSNPWVKKSLDIATLQIETIPTLTPERGREELDTYVWTMARAQAIFLKHICTESLPLAKNEDSGYDLN